eukprot:755744-Hanusia_phi.AAC.1
MTCTVSATKRYKSPGSRAVVPVRAVRLQRAMTPGVACCRQGWGCLWYKGPGRMTGEGNRAGSDPGSDAAYTPEPKSCNFASFGSEDRS